jgi:hypothetical protein
LGGAGAVLARGARRIPIGSEGSMIMSISSAWTDVSALGQSRRFVHATWTSASPSTPDVLRRRSEPTRRARRPPAADKKDIRDR